jgi:hypothetical protein
LCQWSRTNGGSCTSFFDAPSNREWYSITRPNTAINGGAGDLKVFCSPIRTFSGSASAKRPVGVNQWVDFKYAARIGADLSLTVTEFVDVAVKGTVDPVEIHPSEIPHLLAQVFDATP